jgi:hypothetical protein
LTPGTVNYPDGTTLTDQFKGQGVSFSAYDGDLPPEFRRSLGTQENCVQGQTVYNLFRLEFIADKPVVEVSLEFGDRNVRSQTHTVTAFDSSGNVVDSATFRKDTGLARRPFSLKVKSSQGIAFVVAIEQPFGAEMLRGITYTMH